LDFLHLVVLRPAGQLTSNRVVDVPTPIAHNPMTIFERNKSSADYGDSLQDCATPL
jgi:hypothetical protein